jgi:hypothetical protein
VTVSAIVALPVATPPVTTQPPELLQVRAHALRTGMAPPDMPVTAAGAEGAHGPTLRSLQ